MTKTIEQVKDWVSPANMSEIENVLDHGKLYIQVTATKFYKARRNGATKIWKKSPGHFEIPVKFGFKDCARISETYVGTKFIRIEP